MRISDWSSDVCSSDLIDDVVAVREVERTARHFLRRLRCHGLAGTEPVCTLPGIAIGDAHLVGRLEAARVQGYLATTTALGSFTLCHIKLEPPSRWQVGRRQVDRKSTRLNSSH